ncbi:MAG TPA: adenylate/guanylate cyclase domain-containing protein [Candidatus Cloacimonetes bacterium]|nr:adenylate/guanylate cyclase domain-containing protein [Candidatus Cloacimonadota bacterium]
MKNLKYIIVPFVIFIFLRIIFVTSFWENLEHKSQDLLFLLRGPRDISNEVVIIEIGDETFNTLNQQWPFPREYYAHLIENLENAGVKQIIFDIEFTEESNPESDELLAQTAARYNNIIFAGKLIKTIKEDHIKQQNLPPIKAINKRGIPWGTVNISSDDDGFVRRYEMFQMRGKKEKYSIGVISFAMLEKNIGWAKEIENTNKFFRIGDRFIPKITSKSCLINYYGPQETFNYYDFSDVIDDSTFVSEFEQNLEMDINQFYEIKDEFRDKIVLIGVSADEFHDSHDTPFNKLTKQPMPGVEIHANFIEMVKNMDFLYRFSSLSWLIIFFLLCFILFIFNTNVKPTITIAINFVLIIGFVLFSYYIFKNKNILFTVLELPALIIIIYIIGLVFQYVKTAKERKFIKSAFKQYLSPELVTELLKDPKMLEYGGSEKEISVLFSDIRSFTPYTESHTPRETVIILHEYLTAMVEVILNNKGTLDKFVGDAIMALFGTPVELDNHAFWACKAAFEMRQKLKELHLKWENERKDPFETGIGVHSGIATVGNLGSEQIFDYTAIGDTINAGARLESANKEYETQNKIIISEQTYEMAKNRLIVKYLDEAKVKGKKKPINIYELIGIKEEI